MFTQKRISESGISLTETLVAMAIVGFVAAVFVGGLFVSIKGNELSRNRISAESLARSELEYVKASPYQTAWWSYTLPGSPPWWDANHNALPTGYQDYSVTVSADTLSGYDSNIQKITAVVSYKGSQIFSIIAYKAK
jgi:type II secretory pathway pseudopilin PulG